MRGCVAAVGGTPEAWLQPRSAAQGSQAHLQKGSQNRGSSWAMTLLSTSQFAICLHFKRLLVKREVFELETGAAPVKSTVRSRCKADRSLDDGTQPLRGLRNPDELPCHATTPTQPYSPSILYPPLTSQTPLPRRNVAVSYPFNIP